MSYKKFFYFDVETTFKYPSLSDFKSNDTRGYELFLKKCDNLKKFEPDWNRPPDELYIDKSPLMPEYAKIICMSWGMFTDEGELKIGTIIEDEEEDLLRRMLKVLVRASDLRRTFCGFSIKYFDIPIIIKKLYKYDIEIPYCLNYAHLKPWEINVEELSDIWKGLGRNGSSLDEVTYELGLPSPKKNMNGADVFDFYWNKKDIKSITNYCENDVRAAISIAERLKL